MSADKATDTPASAKAAPKAKGAAKSVPPTVAPTVPAPKVKPAKASPTPRTAQSKAAGSEPKAKAKPAKVKKPKLVRDSLTMPKAEYEVLELLKTRATTLQTHVKKTELIRAGIKALAAMTDAGFLTAIKAVPSLKTGRPKQS
jgi:hypothetical protein